MSTSQKISEVNEFTVIFVLNIDDTPAILAPTNLFASNKDRLFGTNNGKWDDVLNSELAITFNRYF